MSLSLPRLSIAVATHTVPASHRLVTTAQRARLARRLVAVARGQGRAGWQPRQLRQATVQVPALPTQVRAENPGSLATPEAVEALRGWLRAAAIHGLLSRQDQAALRGGSPDAALAVLRAAVERQTQPLLAQVGEAAGVERMRHLQTPAALHLTPLLALHDSFSTGSNARLGDPCSLVLVGQDVGLVEWRLCGTVEDRAIRGALDALSSAVCVPTVLPCEHGAALAGSMYIEMAADAVRDARKVDGAWVIDPEAARALCDELGFEEDAGILERLAEFAEFQVTERECAPLPPGSEAVQTWLTGNEGHAAQLVRRLLALADVARKHQHREKFQVEWEGCYGPTVGLCIAPAGFDDWIGEAGSSFYEEDQSLTQTFENPAQLLRVLPASIVAVAVANATCTLLVDYLNAR